MSTLNLIQGSEAWRIARAGKVTSSRISDVVARTKTGWGASRGNYAADIITERLTGAPIEGYKSQAMLNGTTMEPEARAEYAFRRDMEVTQVGFVQHPKIAMAGASPDGWIGKDGEVQIKCPLPATHLSTLLGSGEIERGYFLQVQFGLACSERQWTDWVSYCPTYPPEMQMYVLRIERHPETIEMLETEVTKFLAEIDDKIDRLRRRYGNARSILRAALEASVASNV